MFGSELAQQLMRDLALAAHRPEAQRGAARFVAATDESGGCHDGSRGAAQDPAPRWKVHTSSQPPVNPARFKPRCR